MDGPLRSAVEKCFAFNCRLHDYCKSPSSTRSLSIPLPHLPSHLIWEISGRENITQAFQAISFNVDGAGALCHFSREKNFTEALRPFRAEKSGFPVAVFVHQGLGKKYITVFPSELFRTTVPCQNISTRSYSMLCNCLNFAVGFHQILESCLAELLHLTSSLCRLHFSTFTLTIRVYQ